jgi:outer membrane protein assembly factor BamB/pimeloyl-ACP methyl ester carboxylesterase
MKRTLLLAVAGVALLSCRDIPAPQQIISPTFQTVTPLEGFGVLWGPMEFVRTDGEPNVFTVSVSTPDFEHFEAPFTLHVENGGPEGATPVEPMSAELDRVSSATLELDGVEIFGPSDFSQRVASLSAGVSVVDGAELVMTLASKPGSGLTVWLTGALRQGHGLIGPDGGRVSHPDGAEISVQPGAFSVGAWIVVEPRVVTPPTGLPRLTPTFAFTVTGTPSVLAGSHGASAPAASMAEGNDQDPLAWPVAIDLSLPPEAATGHLEVEVAAAGDPGHLGYIRHFRLVPGDAAVHLVLDLSLIDNKTTTMTAVGPGLDPCYDQYNLLPSPTTSSERVPLIFIHGWQMLLPDCDSWKRGFNVSEKGEELRRYLQYRSLDEGYDFYRFTYPSFNPIAAAAESLANRVREGFPGRNVVLIGHSMGGLVARAAVEMHGLHSQVSKVITLGTPHHGARLADVYETASDVSGVIGVPQYVFVETDGVRDLQPPESGETNFISSLEQATNPGRLSQYHTLAGQLSIATAFAFCGEDQVTCFLYQLVASLAEVWGYETDGIVPVGSALLEGAGTASSWPGYNHTEIVRGDYDPDNGYPCAGDPPACRDDPVLQRVTDILMPAVAVHSVVVTPTEATLSVGASLQLTAIPQDRDDNALPDREVTWSSSDEAVATAVDGFVTAVGAGHAVISATSEGVVGTATITVVPEPTGGFGPWPMSLGDAQQTGLARVSGPPFPNSAAVNVRWQKTLPFAGGSPPVIDADGRVFVGGRFGLISYDNATGSEFPSTPMPSIVSSLAIGPDGTVYACGWTATNQSLLTAVNPADGAVRWNFLVGYMRPCHPPVVARDGTIFTTTPPPLNSQTAVVVAVNPDGSEKWRYEEGNRATSWPVLSRDETQVYAGVGDRIIAFDAQTGEVRWTNRVSGAAYVKQATVDSQDRVFVTGNDGISAFTKSGTLLWWRGWADLGIVALYPGNRLMLSAQTGAVFVGADDGSWISQVLLPDGYRQWGAPGIVDRDGLVYMSAYNLNNPSASGLLALAPAGLQWLFETGTTSGLAFAADGTLILVSEGGIYALGP